MAALSRLFMMESPNVFRCFDYDLNGGSDHRVAVISCPEALSLGSRSPWTGRGASVPSGGIGVAWPATPLRSPSGRGGGTTGEGRPGGPWPVPGSAPLWDRNGGWFRTGRDLAGDGVVVAIEAGERVPHSQQGGSVELPVRSVCSGGCCRRCWSWADGEGVAWNGSVARF